MTAGGAAGAETQHGARLEASYLLIDRARLLDGTDTEEIVHGALVDIESVLGEPAVCVIYQHLADGWAPHAALGRAHSVAAAQTIFEPEST